MSRALLALGSNVGDRMEFLKQAVAGLGDSVRAVSKVYETPPWPPGEKSPMYLNAAVLVRDKNTEPRGWLERAGILERAAGRSRQPAVRYAPRTLDVDVIMVWDDDGRPVISDDPVLTLPHRHAHERAFVLLPWRDLQPDGLLPGKGKVRDLLNSGVVARDAADIHQYGKQL